MKVSSIEARAKDVESFGKKASRRSEEDPEVARYKDPLKEITDLAAARVIAFFPKDISKIDQIINDQFQVVEKIDKSKQLLKEEKLGYQSIHYLVKMNEGRLSLPEYKKYSGEVAEIQVRTILQHAWAEIEHDIQYKSIETIPSHIKRRFLALAGMFEIADREFQAIQDEDERIRKDAQSLIEQNRLSEVEITSDALKIYLDKKLGPDGRMNSFSYEWTAKLLKRLGFSNFEEINQCITGYDDDKISRAIWGTRSGQLQRFENVLLASMGENYLINHMWGNEVWFKKAIRARIEKIKDAGIKTGDFSPFL